MKTILRMLVGALVASACLGVYYLLWTTYYLINRGVS